MAGNKVGGLKAAAKNKANNPDFYKIQGAKGGSTISDNTHLKGFGTRRDLASEAGSKGGQNSRRGTAPRRMHGIYLDARDPEMAKRQAEIIAELNHEEDLTA